MQIGILGLFGAVFSVFMADKVGIHFDWYWWCLLADRGHRHARLLHIDLNAKVLAIFLTCEMLVVLLFDLAIAGDPGPQGLSRRRLRPVDRLRRRARRRR